MKHRWSFLACAGLTAAAIWYFYEDRSDGVLDSAPLNSPPVTYIDDLVVNTSRKYRIAIRQSEGEGITEMRELVKSASLEEMWAYLPKKSLWVEIGKQETPENKDGERYTTGLTIDMPYLEALMHENDAIILYHFHPSKTRLLQDMIEEEAKSGNPLSPGEIARTRLCISELSALPSSADLTSMMSNSADFYGIQPRGSIAYKICSSKGIVEFHLKDKGKEKYAHDTFGMAAFVKGIMKSALVTEFWNDNTQSDPLLRMQEFCEWMSDDYIAVSFTPYAQER